MAENEKIDLALQSMRHALRAIADYCDCMHDEGSGSPDGCHCPVCIAKKALKTEQAIDWRFVSHLDYRRNTMPRERDIVESWKTYLKRKAGSMEPDITMSAIIGDEPTPRDWFVATSVIQWLATNCGMSVLEGAGFKYDWERKRRG